MMNRINRKAMVVEKLRETSFYKMPASTKYHNNFAGGLADHSLAVWLNLETLTTALGLTWEDPDSPFIIAMLHDACKIDAYFYNRDYGVWEHSDKHPGGHAELSLKIAEQMGIELTDEEKACIRWHMGAFDDQENWGKYTYAIHHYPNVLWTHVADMMSAHLDEKRDEDKPAEEPKVCCICGEPLQPGEYGNNPAPLRDEGVCCDHCNFHRVIPARMGGVHNEE